MFAVVLEYCCLTDYKMLITNIADEHSRTIEELNTQFDEKCKKFLENETFLKQNIAGLKADNADIEKDRNKERTLRMKLEEEYMQNSKNHEEEVQLRLRFEQKLNHMHSHQRDIEIKLARAVEEIT